VNVDCELSAYLVLREAIALNGESAELIAGFCESCMGKEQCKIDVIGFEEWQKKILSKKEKEKP
jgi:hypothetical protein